MGYFETEGQTLQQIHSPDSAGYREKMASFLQTEKAATAAGIILGTLINIYFADKLRGHYDPMLATGLTAIAFLVCFTPSLIDKMGILLEDQADAQSRRDYMRSEGIPVPSRYDTSLIANLLPFQQLSQL